MSDTKVISEKMQLVELRDEVRFLLARMDELEWSDGEGGYRDTIRDFQGHVEPSLSRLRKMVRT